MKEHIYSLQNADTRPRLKSWTQNIYFVISISAVILKLMVKITSILGSYRFLRIAWHDLFFTFTSPSSKREFVYPPCCGVEEQMLIFSSSLTPGRVEGSWNLIPKLTIVLIWKTLVCLKFGKTSNRAVENLPHRKLWLWAANDARSQGIIFLVFSFELFVAQCILVKNGAEAKKKMAQSTLIKSGAVHSG